PSQTKSCRNRPRSKKPVSRWRTEPLATTKRASPLKNGRRACSQRCRGIPYETNRSQGPRPVYADLTRQESPLCFARTCSPATTYHSYEKATHSPPSIRSSLFHPGKLERAASSFGW